MIILATPSSILRAYRGDPTKFNPDNLAVDEKEDRELRSFCEKYNLCEDEPSWWLSSYWG